MQLINMKMIYFWDKKIKKWLHVLEANKITNEKNIYSMSLAQKMDFYKTCSKCSCLSNK